jgi:hypothetical protein
MTDFTTTASDSRSFQNSLSVKLAVALSLVLLADWLFYDQRVGISVVIFSIALAGISFAINPVRSNARRTLLAAGMVLAGLAPVVEDLNASSLLLVIFALTSAVSIVAEPKKVGLGERVAAQLDLLLIGPFKLCWDFVTVLNVPALKTGLTVWIVPMILGIVFVSLFASANPLIEKWVSLINLSEAMSHVSVARLLFWTAALSVIWPFVYVRCRNHEMAAAELIPPARPGETAGALAGFFDEASILRSLILFNLLFAVQTGLDAIYLWGGVALPDGLSYAVYAHRGAYPLILTALLAATFVLAAMRPGGPAERSPIIRPLVYLWVAQNVMLVISSILRLDLYVEIYSLTYWSRRRIRLDGTGRRGAGDDRGPDRPAALERLVGPGKPDRARGRRLRLLHDQFRRLHCRLQCDPQPGSIRQRRSDRHALSDRPRAAGTPGH